MKIVSKLLLCALSLMVACNKLPQEEHIVINSLNIKPRSATIVVGGVVRLVATPDPLIEGLTYEWSSDDESVAIVNSNGVVQGIGVGKTNIVCQCSGLNAKVSITVVEPKPEPKPEPTPEPRTLESLLSESLIFSSRQLIYPGTVMQCFDFYDSSPNGWIYFSQCSADSATGSKWQVVLSRVRRGVYGDNTRSGERMFLRWFGHGTNICVEKATDGGEDFVWVNSNGTVAGADYSNNKTFCRLRYQPNTTFEHYTGENFYLDSYKDASGTKYTVQNLQVSIDFEHRRMLVTASYSGKRHCIIYDLDEVLALKEQSVTLKRTWGGEAGTNTERKSGTTTLNARVMDNLTPLGSFRITSNLNTGKYDKTYSCSFQGQAIYGDKIFWYEGQPLESVKGSGVNDNTRAYVEVFDYKGNRLAPRTRVAAVSDFDNLKRLLNLNDNLFSEAEGMQIKDGGKTLYLGITTHLAGATTGNRLSTILEYDYEL